MLPVLRLLGRDRGFGRRGGLFSADDVFYSFALDTIIYSLVFDMTTFQFKRFWLTAILLGGIGGGCPSRELPVESMICWYGNLEILVNCKDLVRVKQVQGFKK